MSGHTKGPWAVHPHSARVVPADHASRPLGGAEDAEFDRATYAQEICALFWPDRNRTEAEVRANARLIAAAPRMFDYIETQAAMGNAAAIEIMESLNANS